MVPTDVVGRDDYTGRLNKRSEKRIIRVYFTFYYKFPVMFSKPKKELCGQLPGESLIQAHNHCQDSGWDHSSNAPSARSMHVSITAR